MKSKLRNICHNYNKIKNSIQTPTIIANLINDQLLKNNDDPTKRMESKIHRCVHKLKSKIAKDEYSKLYLTGSNPDKFYVAAKIHKIS